MKLPLSVACAVAFCAGAAPPSTDSVLSELTAAVARGDGRAVRILTEELRTLVPEGGRSTGEVAARPRSLLSSARKHTASKDSKPTEEAANTCIFDDDVFRLTPEAKKELKFQLTSPGIATALWWIQYGGWYPCAYEGEACACNGQARYGSSSGALWSNPLDVKGSVKCSMEAFGDPAPGMAKECGCHRSTFTLEKRENSWSFMQEAAIFLLRFNARLNWLPFTGDRRYHGMELWAARHGGKPGGTLERFWIDKFLHDVQPHVRGPRCLEWGIHYLNMFPQCTEKYDVKYEPVFYGQVQPHVSNNVVYSSIYTFPQVIGSDLKFELICATQLFEHLEKPHDAVKAIFAVTAPGGAVLYTAPQQAQYHKVPEDYLRYTKAEVKLLFEEAGFCMPLNLMSGSGDFVFDTARDMGLVVQDFTNEEMMEGYQQGFNNIADGAITIHAVAYKPPHPYCR